MPLRTIIRPEPDARRRVAREKGPPMAVDREYGSTATLEDTVLADLEARVAAFVRDPHADMLAAIGPAAAPRVADRDPALAARLIETRQRAEALALDAFAAPDDDAVEASLYLLDWCAPEIVVHLAEQAESDRQRWLLGEYLLGRYPDALESPYSGPLAELPDWKVTVLLEVMHAIAQGASRPADDAEAAAAPGASPQQGRTVNLYETVIVHGTFAKSATWWREQAGTNNFWAYIRQFCPMLYGAGHEFTWSGLNSDTEREQGARDFINWWHGEGAPQPLQVIAHSHGCNVVYIACAMEPKLSVVNLVALGSPVRIEYPPTVAAGSRIQRIHNVYSEYDTIQVLGSLGGRRGEARTLGDGSRITNHHVPWEDPATHLVRVGHGDLHEELVWHGNGLAAKTLL